MNMDTALQLRYDMMVILQNFEHGWLIFFWERLTLNYDEQPGVSCVQCRMAFSTFNEENGLNHEVLIWTGTYLLELQQIYIRRPPHVVWFIRCFTEFNFSTYSRDNQDNQDNHGQEWPGMTWIPDEL
ncbi:hypothetical protein OS493_015619 [Desmophyllum pertusum]|uniref:Uncharacterized protein n=1 Tax=Desmophyllum pertusum TaxID=174260 RepID=A0A9X0CKX0_9CNID|nr:hypothetical protein OS493_015619 [Desmophyllum pertusum]